jgi:flagellin-like protein
MPPDGSERGVTPVVSTILMVAVVVILAATVSVLALGFTDDADQPGPVVGQSSGELRSDVAGSNDQIVRITHVAGDTVQVSEMEVAVEACGESARIVNLPATRRTPTSVPFYDSNLEGNLISQGQFFGAQQWDAGALHEDTGDTFTASSSFEFRIKNGACELDPGDEVVVRVVHTPTNTVFIEKRLVAE